MSKLTHSTDEGMDAIDRRRAIESGNEDLLPAMTAVSDETGRGVLESQQHIVEGIILRRLHDKRIEGYTLEMSKEIEAALSAAPVETWKCAARKQSLPEPADCGWPTCGCDPYADKVIAALEEQGSASPVAQEPVARLVPIKNLVAMLALLPPAPVDVNGKQFAYHDPKAAERLLELRSVFDALIAASPLYTSPPATPAGVGADEIARVFVRWKKSKNLHESLAAQNIEKELLALLSRAGDQSNSTQKDGSR